MFRRTRIIAEAKRLWTHFAPWPLLALFLLPVLPSGLIIVSTGFDGLYGQDPYAYYNYSVGSLRTNLLTLKSLQPFFWPPGYPILVALVSMIVGIKPSAGQLVSLIAGGLTVVFTALLAQEIANPDAKTPRIPWVAGLLVGFMGQLWQSSAVVMSDTTALACATLGVWALVRYGKQAKRGSGSRFAWLGLASGSLSYAVLSRWAYALVAIPCTIYTLWCLIHQPRRKAILHAAGATILIILVLWPILVPIRDFLLVSHKGTPRFVGDLDVYSWSPLTALSRVHTTPDGILSYRFPNGLYYALAPAHRFFFTPLLAPLLLLGFWKVLHQGVIQDRILLLGWIAIIYLFHIGAPYQNFRFTLAYLPPMAILATTGFESLVERSKLEYRWIPSFALVIGLGWMGYGGWNLTQQLVETKNARLDTVRWVETQLPHDAWLVTFDITLTFQHYSQIETQDIFFLNPKDLEDLLDTGRPIYLLLNLENVKSQWVEKSPYHNYRWFQEVRGLVPVGKQGVYSLFKIKTSPSPLSVCFKSPN